MTGVNHVVGGVVFTGIFGSIIGFNILSDPWYIAMTVVASLFPDIDHTKSLIGKFVWPVAKWIDRRYGHRTITHSILFLILTSIIVQAAQSYTVDDSTFTTIWILGFTSHLIYDMVTVQGVPLFYPFMRNACVIPANPRNRMRTNNMRSEAQVFGFFIVMLIAFKPLVSTGFWTSYNRLFGTMDHLLSEYHKTEDLINVDYTYHIASDEFKGSGYLVECTANKAALIDGDNWKILDKSMMVIDEVLPTHTGIRYSMERVGFVAIDSDSLNRVLSDKQIIEYELEANDQFNAFIDGRASTIKKLKGNYAMDIQTDVDGSLLKKTSVVVPKYKRNPRLAALAREIQRLKKDYTKANETYQAAQTEIEQLKSRYPSVTDLYEKEEMLSRIKELQKVKSVEYPADRIEDKEAQAKELSFQDYQKFNDKKAAYQLTQEQGKLDPVRFSGFIRYFVIKGRVDDQVL